MGKRLHEESIRLNLEINGNKAQKEIYDLEKASRELKERNKEIREELKLARKQFGRNSVEVKKLTTEFDKNSKSIKANSAKVKELEGELKVAEMTTKQLKSRAVQLRIALANMVGGGDDRKRLENELRDVNNQLSKMNMRVKQQKLTMSGAANWLNKYQTMIAGITVAVTGVVLSLGQWLQYSGKLADQQADVQKTTGMTREEVEALTASLAQLDTRSSRIDLLKIAEQGGRIGILKEDIADFVEVMDKANVALGDAFTGGPEEIADMLGKIKNLFQETKDLDVGPAFESIGSGLNVIAAQGAASEKNVAEFMQRVGAMPDVLRPAVGDAMGLGAAMEESNIQAEIGARAYSIFMKQAAEKLPKFAEVMGVSAEEAKKLFDADPTQFFLKFSKNLNESTDSASDMANTMAKLGLNADGVNKIVGAAGSKFDRYQELIKTSNEAMVDATSLTDEFNVKNENLAAMLEKINRWLKGIFTSKTIMNGLEWMVRTFGQLVGVLDENDESVQRWRRQLFFAAKVLAVVIASLLSYKAAHALVYLWTTKNKVATELLSKILSISAAKANTMRASTLLLSSAKALLTGNIKKATQAFRLFSLTMNSNPIGLIITAITTLVTVYQLFIKQTRESTEAMSEFEATIDSVNKETAKNISTLELYYRAATDVNRSMEERLLAVRKLKSEYPEYFKNLSDEIILAGQAADAYDKLKDSILNSAKSRLAEEAAAKFVEERLKVRGKINDLKKKEKQLNIDLRKSEGLTAKGAEQQLKQVQAAIQLNQFEMKRLQGVWDETFENIDISANFDTTNTTTTSNVINPITTSGSKSNAKRSRENELESIIKQTEQFNKEIIQLRYDLERAELEIIDESYEKEKAELDLQHRQKLQQLKDNMVSEKEMMAMEMAKSRAQKQGDTGLVTAINQQIEAAKAKNVEIDSLMTQLEWTFFAKLNKLAVEYGTKNIEDNQKLFERQKAQAQAEFNNKLASYKSFEEAKQDLAKRLSAKELAQIKDWDDAKAEFQKEFNKEELQRELDHLNDMIALIESDLSNGVYNGVSLLDIPEEEKEKIFAFLEQLKVKSSEVALEITNIQNKNPNKNGKQEAFQMQGGVDLFGMGAEQWLEMFNNLENTKGKLMAIQVGFNMLTDAMSKYYQRQDQKSERSLQRYEQVQERQKSALKHQLDQGLINQQEYDEKVAELEIAMERRKAELEYQQAKRQKAQALMNVAMQTAQALISLWVKPGFPAAIPLAGVVSALGAVQTGIIASQKIPKPSVPGYEAGYGYEDVIRAQDGKPFRAKKKGIAKSGLVNEPSLYLAGEGGRHMPEMIIDPISFKRFDPTLKDALYSELRRVNGYQGGYYPTAQPTNVQGVDFSELSAKLDRNNELLEIIAEKELVFPRTLQTAKVIKQDIEELEKLRNDAKQ